MKKLYNRFIAWLFMTGYNATAVDKDNDGLVQEGTPYERKVETVKKAATAKKSPAKKTAEKAPAKKTTAKKTVAKKTAPKTTKKK